MPNRIKRKQAVEYIIDGIRTSNELCVDKCRCFWRSPMRCGLFGVDLKLTKYQDAYRCELCLSLVGNEQDYFSIKDEDKLNYINRKLKMNREILFRGIAIHDNQFVYGNYIHSKRMSGYSCEHRIVNQETGLETDVMPETLGQFAGRISFLLDDNDNVRIIRIFEGDRIKTENGIGTVFYDEAETSYAVLYDDNSSEILGLISGTIEIIGTIHDHLLKGEQCQTN